MSKTKVEFTYDNTDYTLEFTADSLRKMEREGFNFRTAEDRLVTVNEDIFCGAFIEHHNNVPKAKRLEIYKQLEEMSDGENNIDDVIGQMMSEAVDELRTHTGNVSWRVRK